MPVYRLLGGRVPVTCHGEDARIAVSYELTRLKLDQSIHRIELQDGTPLRTRSVWERHPEGWRRL